MHGDLRGGSHLRVAGLGWGWGWGVGRAEGPLPRPLLMRPWTNEPISKMLSQQLTEDPPPPAELAWSVAGSPVTRRLALLSNMEGWFHHPPAGSGCRVLDP